MKTKWKEHEGTFKNTIFAKSLSALYDLNIGKDGRSKLALVDAIYQGLLIGKEGLEIAKLEMALETATDDWLDYWGYILNVSRIHGEDDDKYRERIIWEIIYPKNTVPAIEERIRKYIEDRTNERPTISIFEPWTQLLKPDSRGTLDGSARLVSYDYWNYGYIDISIPDTSLITDDLVAYLKRIKSAGIQVVWSLAPNFGIIKTRKPEDEHSVYFKINRSIMLYAKRKSNAFLTYTGVNPNDIEDSDNGGLLDKRGLLEGSSFVYSETIHERYLYGTGVLRNHLGSAVLSLEDYLILSENPNMTIEEAIAFEEESTMATDRANEGKLTMAQKGIKIIHEPI